MCVRGHFRASKIPDFRYKVIRRKQTLFFFKQRAFERQRMVLFISMFPSLRNVFNLCFLKRTL